MDLDGWNQSWPTIFSFFVCVSAPSIYLSFDYFHFISSDDDGRLWQHAALRLGGSDQGPTSKTSTGKSTFLISSYFRDNLIAVRGECLSIFQLEKKNIQRRLDAIFQSWRPVVSLERNRDDASRLFFFVSTRASAGGSDQQLFFFSYTRVEKKSSIRCV